MRRIVAAVVVGGSVIAFGTISALAVAKPATKRAGCTHLDQGRYAPKGSPCLVANRYRSGFIFASGRSTDVSNFGAIIRYNAIDATHEPYLHLHVADASARIQITRVAFKHDGAPVEERVLTETVRFRAAAGMELTRVFLEHPHHGKIVWTPLKHGQRSVTVTQTFPWEALNGDTEQNPGSVWVESART
jgi:hypothetical protein